MNLRQKKKKEKIMHDRLEFFQSRFFFEGLPRKNGKTTLYNNMIKTCLSKKYKPFKQAKKYYEDMIIATDYGNIVDFAVQTTAIVGKGKVEIIKREII